MKKILIILIIFSMALTSGCWDMVEINEKSFPYSIAIDLNDEDEGLDKYVVTISYLNINGIGKNATQEERVFIVSVTASSIFEAVKKLSTGVPYPFDFKNIRVLVLGQELAKDDKLVRQIMDGLSRDYNINKKLQIIVSEDKGREVMDAIPKSLKQEEIEGTLYSMLRDRKTAARFSPKGLTDFIRDINKQNVSIVPRVAVEEDEIKIFGGAIFSDYALVGKIDEVENRSIAFMNDIVRTELIDIPYGDAIMSYSISGQSSKKKLIKEDGKLKFRIDIEVEGTLQSYIIIEDSKADRTKDSYNMEKAINDVLEEQMQNTMDIMQNKYKVDIIGVGENIRKFHPKIWKEIEGDWDTVFQEMEIEINVDSKIRRRGLTE